MADAIDDVQREVSAALDELEGALSGSTWDWSRPLPGFGRLVDAMTLAGAPRPKNAANALRATWLRELKLYADLTGQEWRQRALDRLRAQWDGQAVAAFAVWEE